MSRRTRNKSSDVRGPNSALTEFLRVEGITDAFRRRREREQDQMLQTIVSGDASEGSTEDVPTSATDTEVVSPARRRGRSAIVTVDSEDEEVEQIKDAARRKRRAGKDNFIGADDDDDDDEGDDDFVEEDGDVELGNEYKQSGEEDVCVECDKTFRLTVYSRYDKVRKGYLCEECNEDAQRREKNNRKNQLNARKKRKKVAQALLNKSTVKIPSLQDICIKMVTKNIDQVEALGNIGTLNMNKISKILSKNRSLNNSTMTLFLTPDSRSLEFYDCSNVDSGSFNKIASFCPQLESLKLFMCGQLHNDNLQYFHQKLPNLKDLSLNGPFLISESMWQEFFEVGGKNLTKFEVRNTHRFTNDSLISLLENCGKNLECLKLSRLDGIDSAEIYELIPHYLSPNQMTDLEISYPKTEELITDELMINILAVTGDSLTFLNLDGCTNLTSTFINEALVKFSTKLTHLSLKDLDQLDQECDFSNFGDMNGGLISLDLSKCIELSESAVYDLLRHSCSTLVELSLNSVSKLSKDFFWQILTDDFSESKKNFKETMSEEETFFPALSFPLLTSLDLGFVRAVDDQILNLLGKRCPRLKVLEVFGNNKCTYEAKLKDDLIVIGRQGDSI